MTQLREAPGIFQGTANSAASWYVVDPSSADDPELTARAWHERFRNESRGRRRARLIGGWSIFVGILVLGLIPVAVLSPFPVAAALVGLGTFVVAIIASVAAVDRWSARKQRLDLRVRDVVEIDPDIVQWAKAGTSRETLWELSLAVGRVLHVIKALSLIEQAERECARPIPGWSLAPVLRAGLVVTADAQLTALEELAEQTGFVISWFYSRETLDSRLRD